MYLFQPGARNELNDLEYLFTFHYVSISTNVPIAVVSATNIFTFHYVSIST